MAALQLVDGVDAEVIDDAYRSLPHLGELQLLSAAAGLTMVLQLLEQRGFIAIAIGRPNSADGRSRVRAFKTRGGACYDTGVRATYLGSAVAAIDDDHHLIRRSVPLAVCEKTAAVYGLPVYSEVLALSGPDPHLQARLLTAPAEFDCDDWESGLRAVAAELPPAAQTGERQPLFYPGPFRLLILSDGTIMRRGQATLVPVASAAGLSYGDGCFTAAGMIAGESIFFQEIYKQDGPLGLSGSLSPFMSSTALEFEAVAAEACHLESLVFLGDAMRSRLLACIDGGRGHFLLTGSDPADAFGCCPSTDVGEANALVRAGVLRAAPQSLPPGACPITVYSFAGESPDGATALNHELRGQVRRHLQPRSSVMRTILQWSLLAFVMASLVVAAGKAVAARSAKVVNAYQVLGVAKPDCVVVCLLHSGKRCPFCLDMEHHAQAALARSFAGEMAAGEVIFLSVDADVPELQPLAERFGLFTSTIVLLQFRDGREVRSRQLTDLWELTDNEAAFAETMRQQLRLFLDACHE